MPYNYAYQEQATNVAKAVARDVSVSPKAAIMLANFIRNKSVSRAQRDLAEVIKQKQAVPFTRFSEGASHKPGIGPGKYPVKAAKEFLTLVNSVAANALDLGLGEDLKIVSVVTHQAAKQMRYGRQRGRQRKAAHIEIIVAENQDAKRAPKKAQAKPAEKKEVKAEPKSEAAKADTPEKAPAKETKPKADKPAEKKAAAKPAKKETPKEESQ